MERGPRELHSLNTEDSRSLRTSGSRFCKLRGRRLVPRALRRHSAEGCQGELRRVLYALVASLTRLGICETERPLADPGSMLRFWYFRRYCNRKNPQGKSQNI